MPANTQHAKYGSFLPLWKKARDTVQGEEAVKAAGSTYLPHLSEQDSTEYEAYKKRALFFSATGRTVDGLSGAIRRKPTKIEFPNEDDLKHIGRAKESREQMEGVTIREVLSVGRLGLLVDAPAEDGAPPYVSIYYAEDIINWREDLIAGRKVPTMVVLLERLEQADPKDPYKVEEVVQYRCLHLGTKPAYSDKTRAMDFAPGYSESDVKQPFYYQEVWREDKQSTKPDKLTFIERIVPKMTGGRLWREIPFVFVNSTDTDPCPSEPPLLDLVNVNLSHYRTSADLEHGRHWTALPTPWFAGFKFAGPVKIGSGICHTTDDPSAHAGMLEFTGAGLGHLKEAIAEKERQMAALGSRLLEPQKAAQEAAEAIRLRTAGEQSALALISKTLSNAWTQVLHWLWTWTQTSDAGADKIVCTLNTDFGISGLDSAQMTSMMAAVQGGLMSFDTWFFNLQRAEVIPDDVTVEDERERIAAGLPSGMGLLLGGPGSQDPNAPPPDAEDPAEESDPTEEQDGPPAKGAAK